MKAASFERLIAEHRQGVLRVCCSILRDDHLGADAAQETFLRLWRAAPRERTPRSVAAWLRRVAVTTSLDQLRGRRRQREEPGAAEEARSEHAPDAELSARELAERFEHALETLPDGQRTIFLLKHHGELSLSQVAETLDLALPTVKTQFARACLKLQRALRPFAIE